MEKRVEWKTLPVMLAVFLFILSLAAMACAAFAMDFISDMYISVESAIFAKEEESQKRWNNLVQLNVFDELENTVLCPTNSGSYGFEVYNDAKYPISYELNITDENLAKVPMQFRLKDKDGAFLAGDSNTWVPITELSGIPGTLDYEGITKYTLDWRWEGTDDAADTNSGILAQNRVLYILNFELVAEQNGAPINSLIDTAPQLNNLAFWITLLATAIMVGGEVLIWHFVWRKDRKNSEK